MLSRVVPTPSLLATLGLAVLPAVAMAQSPVSRSPIVHSSIYTARLMGELLASNQTPRTNMPQVNPKQMPMAAMQSHNTLPSGAYALLPGVALGSSDGVHHTATGDKGVVSDAYGNFSPQSIAPYTTARASASILGPTSTAAAVGVTSYPWRSTGKLSYTQAAILNGH